MSPIIVSAGVALVSELATKVVVPAIKQIATKPVSGIKEASVASIGLAAVAIYDQYQLGGVEAIAASSVGALAAGLWVLAVRLYHKSKD